MHIKMDNNPIHVLDIIEITMRGYKKVRKSYQSLSEGEKKKCQYGLEGYKNLKSCWTWKTTVDWL